MNKSRSFQFLLAGVAVALLASCANNDLNMAGNKSPVGVWVNKMGTVWTIRPDGTFYVDLTHKANPDVFGKYTISGDEITLEQTAAAMKLPRSCRKSCVYKWKRDGNALNFGAVRDGCKTRRDNIMSPWVTKR